MLISVGDLVLVLWPKPVDEHGDIFRKQSVVAVGLSGSEGGYDDSARGCDGKWVEGRMEETYTGSIEARRSEYEYDRKLLQPVQG